MATTSLRLSSKVGGDGRKQVIVKLTIDRDTRPCFKSGVFINPDWFKPVKETKKGNVMGIVPPKKGKFNIIEVNDASRAKKDIDDFVNRLTAVCNALNKNDVLTKKYEDKPSAHDIIEEAVRLTMPIPVGEISYKAIQDAKEKQIEDDAKEKTKDMTFFDWYERFMVERGKEITKGRIRRLEVVGRMLFRYESFIRETDKKKKDFRLDIHTIDKDILEDFFDYLVNEKSLSDEYPVIFAKMVKDPIFGKRRQVVKERGRNVMVSLKKTLKSFFNWLNEQGYTDNRPFAGIKIGTEKYGTPYYLTLDERNLIADFDMDSKWESMPGEEKESLRLKTSFSTIKAQRDIFIFQCLIGCRVSDLLAMTPSNIDNGIVSYIPIKTRNERPVVVRVPLNQRAKALVEKYQGVDRKGRLFPFISSQRYDDSIKDVLRLCGIERMITKLNPVTGEEVQHPIWEVASSHMARRTFVGNLYKKLKDPKLVGSLSGHAENSTAFVRYREIDDDIKKEVVALID